MTPIPGPRYSASELVSCQLLNDLTAATLRLGLLVRSGLPPAQLVHAGELARCLAVAVATITAAYVDGVDEDVHAPRPTAPRRPLLLDGYVPQQDHDNHPAD